MKKLISAVLVSAAFSGAAYAGFSVGMPGAFKKQVVKLDEKVREKKLKEITTSPSNSPTQVGTATNWSSVSPGAGQILAIKTDGTLWAWGENVQGQLGLGYTSGNYIPTPTQVGVATNWSSASASQASLAVKGGTLWAWGNNGSGQLGLGNSATTYYSPTQVGIATTWSSVSCGQWQTLAVKTDATLWAWGNNGFGQLGLGNTVDGNTPTQVGVATNWSSVSAGAFHTLAVKTNGTLWAWGNNVSGQLGLGNTTTTYYTPTQVGAATNWSSVSGSRGYHTLAIKTDGTLWAWGGNGSGQLGLGNTTTTYYIPTQVGTATNWASVSGGYDYTLAVKTDGTLWAWGDNSSSQLGLGDTTARYTPTQVGTATNWASGSCGYNDWSAVKTDGTLWSN